MAESDHSYPYSYGEEEEGQGTCEEIMPQQGNEGITPQLSDPAVYGKPIYATEVAAKAHIFYIDGASQN